MILVLQGCTATGTNKVETTAQPTPETSAAPLALTPDQVWAKHKEELLDIRSWSLKGKMSVKTSQKGGSASVRWERTTGEHDVQIYGPFGGGRVRITEDPFGATLTDSKGNVAIGDTAYDLLYEHVGWPVPFDALKYWVIGLPIPDVWAQWRLNEQGQLAWLSQAGWEVEFEQYQDREGVLMPRKLTLVALPGTVNLTFPDGTKSDVLQVKFIVQRVAFREVNAATAPGKPAG